MLHATLKLSSSPIGVLSKLNNTCPSAVTPSYISPSKLSLAHTSASTCSPVLVMNVAWQGYVEILI